MVKKIEQLAPDCVHHWYIWLEGTKEMGKCRKCGEVKVHRFLSESKAPVNLPMYPGQSRE